MVLPHELLPFAENLYRRFPEEFMALGMPGLEQIYDLRTNGSRSRKMSESPTEKTVEITMRRWQPAQMPPLHPNYGCIPEQVAPPQALPGQAPYYGGWQPPANAGFPFQAPVNSEPSWRGQPHQPQQSVTPAANPAAEAQMTSHLSRLESALSSLMPQIEAAVMSRAQPQVNFSAQAQSNHHYQQQYQSKPIPREVEPDVVQEEDHMSPASPLRNRRGAKDLRVAPPPRAGGPATVHVQTASEASAASAAKPPPAAVEVSSKPESPANGGAKDERSNARAERDRERPQIQISAVRMAPNAMDPESPRSPGRYSAWK